MTGVQSTMLSALTCSAPDVRPFAATRTSSPSDEQPPAASPPPPQPNRSDRLDTLLESQPGDSTRRGVLRSVGEGITSMFVPRNVAETMTPDYLSTRAWWLGREVTGNISYGFAASQATTLALELLVKAQPGAAVATVGLGLGMYWFPKIVDQLRNVTSMATSFVAPVADRRPKAWFLAGDILDNIGTAVMSCAALVPNAYAPLSIGVGAAFTVAGVIKRRAQSNMFYRQAKDPIKTLPEINTKESNQSIVLNLISMAAGAGIQYGLGGTALASALPVVGCAAAALGVLATVKFLKHLDMETINETVVRRAVDQMEHGEDIPEPDRRVSKLLGQLLERDTIELGQSLDRLKQAGAARYQTLLKTYANDAYILESYKGKPHIVVKDGAKNEDCLTAIVQGIQVERLAVTPGYAEMVATQGSDAADYWLVEQSLARARQQAPGLLQRLADKGWAADLVNFRNTDMRVTDDDLARPLRQGQVTLP